MDLSDHKDEEVRELARLGPKMKNLDLELNHYLSTSPFSQLLRHVESIVFLCRFVPPNRKKAFAWASRRPIPRDRHRSPFPPQGEDPPSRCSWQYAKRIQRRSNISHFWLYWGTPSSSYRPRLSLMVALRSKSSFFVVTPRPLTLKILPRPPWVLTSMWNGHTSIK